MTTMNFAYRCLKTILRLYHRLFIYEVDARGLEHIPPGPKIIVANHTNASDCFTLPLILKDKLHYVIQGSMFDLPVLGKLLSQAEQVPAYPGQGLKMIQDALQKLSRGGSIVIFPEGRLNNGEGLLKAGIGAAMLAIKARVPVVPLGFYVSGKDILVLKAKIFRSYVSSGGWQWRGKIMLRFGEPVMLSLDNETQKLKVSLRKVTKEIMERVDQLVDEARQELEGISNELGPEPSLSQRLPSG
jgi:1-acyl-sn-glycerol-3-phosphate acyltransferase